MILKKFIQNHCFVQITLFLVCLENGSVPFCAKKCRLIEKISLTRTKNFKLKLKNVTKSHTNTTKQDL